MKEKIQSVPIDRIMSTSLVPGEVLVKVEQVSKKFCKNLKRSLWYGVKDLSRELMRCQHEYHDALRKDEFWAVKDVSFELRRGECVGVIGHNGAGKSTLLKMLNGLIKPDQGKITICGRVGALLELGAGFHPVLSGRENIYINGQILGFTKQEIDKKFDQIVEFAEIDSFIDMPVQHYSSGMRVRLGFSIAAQMEPDVLILDEVLAVGDIGFQVKCLNRIHELLQNSAVIFVSHSMAAVARISTHGLLMKKGVAVVSSSHVSNVIDKYHEQYSIGERKVIGSGEVEILNTYFLENERSREIHINFKSKIKINIDLKVRTTCEYLNTRLYVWNQEQRPVMEILSNDYDLFVWKNISNNVSILVESSEITLAAGKYAISIVLFDFSKMQVINRIDNALVFVMGHHVSSGCENFCSAKWSVNINE